mgnify:CR=1 FL=1
MFDIKYNAGLPSGHYCSRDARVRASRKKEKKEKRKEKKRQCINLRQMQKEHT